MKKKADDGFAILAKRIMGSKPMTVNNRDALIKRLMNALDKVPMEDLEWIVAEVEDIVKRVLALD